MQPKASILAALCCGLTPALAVDWPQYRGPNGDGTSPEVIRTNWAEQAPREVWRKRIGQGWSSMAVSGGRVFTQVRRSANGADREFCVALDANTGNELWGTDVDAANYTNLSGYDDRIDGPRSTPTVEGDRVYVFTSQLKLYCLRFDNGNIVWSRDFPAELGSNLIAWENAASPLIVGELVFVNSNAGGQRLMAVRKSDGVTAWGGQNDGMTHASPVFARIGDVPQVLFLTRSGLVSVIPETGAVLWRVAFSPSATSTAASPVVAGDYVHASAAYGSGTWIARVEKNGSTFTASDVRRQQGNAYQLHWATPVHHEGFLYCVPSPSSGQARLACLDVAGGANRWTQTAVGSGNIGYGSVIKAANALVVLTEAGELVLVQADPSTYTELAKMQVLNFFSWNHVALSNGRIYARNSAVSPEIVALEVGAAVAPLPAIGLAAERTADGGAVKLIVRAVDGTNLDSSHVARLEVQSTPAIAPPGQWSALNQTFSVTAGMLITEIQIGADSRFLRIGEKIGTN
ncbi:MAG: PQQ-like beta-propeller repeat protein [Verrucomicrobiales bacterium]|nr:PQQ-like beta-propeller repeat protein [Verrucomicrobiales bacterium]